MGKAHKKNFYIIGSLDLGKIKKSKKISFVEKLYIVLLLERLRRRKPFLSLAGRSPIRS